MKWYLDTVEPDGAAAIAYWASLTWHGVHIAWQNVTRYALDQPPAERSSLRGMPAPVLADRQVSWHAARIGLETVHEATSPGVSITLLDDARGRIGWECLAPSARAQFTDEAGARQGVGYVERMTMTVPPWELPIDELRWGRWVSDDAATSMVWIDWRGPLPRRWVVQDGAVFTDVTVRDDGVEVSAGRLALAPPRTLHDRSVGRFLRRLSDLAHVAARIPISWHETKWCNRATWTSVAGVATEGWAIHEVAKFT
ncbi:MAG: hypothetical protein ACYC7F_04250 [Gemmatimonadaceae bacterium]